MAAVVHLGTINFSTSSGTKTLTATPTVDDLIVIVTAHTGNTSAAAPTDNNSDGGGTYSQVTACAAVKNASADQMRIFIRDHKINSASSTVFTHAPGATTGGGIDVFRVTGMSRVGLNAARQGAVQSNHAAGSTPTPVLTVAALTGNPLIGAVFNASSPATITPRSSPAWSEGVDVGYSTPTTGLETASINSGETATSIAWGSISSSAFASSVLELDASVPDYLKEKPPEGAEYIIRMWDPPPPWPFMGGWQELMSRRLNPSLLNNPPPPPALVPEILFLDAENLAAYYIRKEYVAATLVVVGSPTGDLSSAGVGTATFVGSETATGDLSAAGVATGTFVGSTTQNYAPKTRFQQQIVSAWQAPFILQPRQRFLPQTFQVSGRLTSAGVATATFVGQSSQNTAPKAEFQQHIIAAWQQQFVLPQTLRVVPPQVAAASATGDLSSAGTATATFVGSDTAQADLSADGAATATFTGTSAQNVAPKTPFQQHIISAWELPSVPKQLRRLLAQSSTTSASGDLFSQAVADATLVGASLSAADLSAAGAADATFEAAVATYASADWLSSGTSTVTFRSPEARATNLDGWLPERLRADRLRQRRRKDEEEIMAIVAAVMPYIQRGVKAPMRISL